MSASVPSHLRRHSRGSSFSSRANLFSSPAPRPTSKHFRIPQTVQCASHTLTPSAITSFVSLGTIEHFSSSAAKSKTIAQSTRSLAKSTSRQVVNAYHQPRKELRTLKAKYVSYSGLVVSSLLLASFLPFAMPSSSGKGKGRGRRKQSTQKEEAAERVDNSSMAAEASAKTKQHRNMNAQAHSQIHVNHRSGSSLRASDHGSSYRPRRTTTPVYGNRSRGSAASRRSVGGQRRADTREKLRRQGWR